MRTSRTKIYLQRQLASHLIDMVLAVEASVEGRTITSVAGPITLHHLGENDMRPVEPTMSIATEDAQQWMDELWRVGVRPASGEGSVGQLAATEKHLEDMRCLAFHAIQKTEPPTKPR